jgi:hypothetical protein
VVVVVVALALLAVSGTLAGSARAAGNASSAAGFIENAQRADGGFAATHGGPADPAASLWATVALLAAGKNPESERVNNGSSADDYLAAHLSSYRALEDLGLLAIIQAGSGAPADRYGDPETQLKADLTVPAIRTDPGGAALGTIGLLALKADGAAAATARTLLGDQLSDDGWGADGESDSATTALVLEAIAQTGVANDSNPAVARGVDYLHKAQVNDGSIATSDRTDSSSSGDVAATAFTIQALAALHHPTLRTATGTSVLQGLASYQQMSTGGLSPFGAYDTGVAASVTQTAQAYPAFDGVAFPLPYVAPAKEPVAPAHPAHNAANRASVGSATAGVSSSTQSGPKKVGAYHGGSAAGSVKAKAGRASSSSGTQVNGTVVGAQKAPKLTTRAGRAPAKNYDALILALALLAVAVLGAAFDFRRPRDGGLGAPARVVQAGAVLLAAARRRRAFAPAAVVLVGVALIALPAMTGMWSRAPHGAAMIHAFAPYMREPKIVRLQGDVAVLNAAFRTPHAGSGIHWPAIHSRLSQLMSTISANRGNYAAIASLPSFDLFPWFLVIPGALLALLGAAALVWPRAWRRLGFAIAALGAALALAPLAVGLYGAAPRGAQLISGFAPIETRAGVTALQNDFSSIVIGESSAVSGRAAHVPAVEALNHDWVRILGDFTPVLGVMSDSVANYDAVAALPDFSIFPWLFAIPGLLAIVIVSLSRPRSLPMLRRVRTARKRQLEARSSA